MLESDLIDVLSSHFMIQPKLIISVGRGLNGQHYLVKGCNPGEKFIASLRPLSSVGRVSNALRLQMYLNDQGLPVPRPLATTEGRPLLWHSDSLVTVAEFVAGDCGGELAGDELLSIGRVVGKIHMTHQLVNMPNERSMIDLLMLLERSDLKVPLEFQLWLDQVFAEVEMAKLCQAPRGIVHGDLFSDNIVMAEQGPVLLDWEGGANGVLVIDVATALIGLCSTSSRSLSFSSAYSFLKGYQAARHFDFIERNLLRDAVIASACGFTIRRFVRYGSLMGEPGSGRAAARDLMVFVDNLPDRDAQVWDTVLG